MSGDVLRRAANGMRDEWADAELHIKPTAFYLAVADWLEACALVLDVKPDTNRVLALNVARAYLGESA